MKSRLLTNASVLMFLFFISGCQDASFASGKEATKQYEGFREEVYRCSAGALTIGYGFNMSDPAIAALIPADVRSGRVKMKRADADVIFEKIYKQAERDAINFAGKQVFSMMTQEQKDVLIDMAYNLGSDRLAGFPKMREALALGNYRLAAAEMKDSRWYNQTGRRARHHVEVFSR